MIKLQNAFYHSWEENWILFDEIQVSLIKLPQLGCKYKYTFIDFVIIKTEKT